MPFEFFKRGGVVKMPHQEVNVELKNDWDVDDEDDVKEPFMPKPMDVGMRAGGGGANPIYQYGGIRGNQMYHQVGQLNARDMMYQDYGHNTTSVSTKSTSSPELQQEVRKLTKAVEDLTRIVTEMKLREHI
jgi:hypothetical protein